MKAILRKFVWFGVTLLFGGGVASACADRYTIDASGSFDKPIIVVKGYSIDESLEPDYLRGLSELKVDGRDLVLVDFTSDRRSFDENAIILSELISEINQEKRGSHPNAVIGYSMGGIIAKRALKYMEDSGLNHEASVYFSYDSPHLGVNIPGDVVYTVKFLQRKSRQYLFHTIEPLEELLDIFENPAVGEMLIQGPGRQYVSKDSFPEKVANIAITSGSLTGEPLSRSLQEGIYVAQFRIDVAGVKEWTRFWRTQDRGGVYFDDAPGSYLPTFHEFHDALMERTEGTGLTYTFLHLVNERNISFVPTLSALAINDYDLRGNDSAERFEADSGFDKYIAEDGTRGCETFNAITYSQTSPKASRNKRHDNFHESQLVQIQCALDQYHTQYYTLPDRGFDATVVPTATAITLL